MEIGNQMQNHKIETNSELIYGDGSIWSTLIFIKIIGSDTLRFPFPPSEVLLPVIFSNKFIQTIKIYKPSVTLANGKIKMKYFSIVIFLEVSLGR